jgi:hypothetical protein
MVKTNDPKRLKSLNDELTKTRKNVESITNRQKEQVKVVEALNKKQSDLVKSLRATNDPKAMQGLLQNLYKVENQLSSLTAKASSMGSKFGEMGKTLLSGLGLGIGAFGAQQGLQAISSFVSSSIEEFEDAKKTALDLQRALKAIGKEKYFDGLLEEADKLAAKFFGLFDNDDIIKAQTALVQYGKVTRNEISKLLPIILELSTAEKIDLLQATEKVVNIMEGRGGQTLRDYGLSVKGVKTEHDRLNLILGEFQKKLKGSAEVYSQTADGIAQKNAVIIGGIEERFGKAFSEIKLGAMGAVTPLLEGLVSFMNQYEDFASHRFGRSKQSSVQLKGWDPTKPDNWPGTQSTKEILAQKRKEDALKNMRLNPNADMADEDEVKKAVKKVQKVADKKENKVVIKTKLAEDDPTVMPEFFRHISAIQKQLRDKDIENDNKQAAEDLIRAKNYAESEAKAANEAKKEIDEQYREQKRRDERQFLFDNAINFANEVSAMLSIEEARTAKQISLQEKRVDASKNSSEKSLKIEQDRLDELVRKRQSYEKAQRAIDATVIIANQAVAISGAVRTIASGGNPILIAANVLAILAGIGATVSAIRSINADEGFKEGGYTGDGDPSKQSTRIGKRSYKYHHKEFVVNEGLTAKHRDMLEGLHNGRLAVSKMRDGYYLSSKSIDTDKAIADYYTVKNNVNMTNVESVLGSIDSRLAQREVNIRINNDSHGMAANIAYHLGRVNLINKLRN